MDEESQVIKYDYLKIAIVTFVAFIKIQAAPFLKVVGRIPRN